MVHVKFKGQKEFMDLPSYEIRKDDRTHVPEKANPKQKVIIDRNKIDSKTKTKEAQQLVETRYK